MKNKLLKSLCVQKGRGGSLVLLFLLCCLTGTLKAQDMALKTNLLYWGTTTPNLSWELGLGKKTSIELTGAFNPWTLKKETNKKIKHWMVMPEFRYWFCERFNGHFLGLHTGYAFYNVSGVRIPFEPKHTKDHRYQGWATGAGLAYGYSWVLGSRFNIEATLGIGYIFTKYDKFDCATCGKFRGSQDKHYFGPTKAAVSIIYNIK